MDAGSASGGPSLKQLILVPAVITLGVTLLRLVGELQNWSPRFFNRVAGGGGAIVGIGWLIPVFGIYFALKLARSGQDPTGPLARAFGYAFLGLLIVVALGVGASAFSKSVMVQITAFVIGSVIAIPVALRGWPALGRTLLAYGFAARIPVAIVMLFAILGDWGTHYDAPPPEFPASNPWVEWFLTGLIPQMTIWIFTTVVGGMIVGAIAAALTRKKAPAAA